MASLLSVMNPIETVIDSSESKITWTLPNFSKINSRIQSEELLLPIKNSNTRLCLVVQHFGMTNEMEERLLIEIEVSSDHQVFLDCKLTILDCDNRRLFFTEKTNVPTMKWIYYDSRIPDDSFTTKILNSWDGNLLPLKNDILIIKGTIKINLGLNQEILDFNYRDYDLHFNNFKNLLNDSTHSDVTLETSDGTKIFAHKCILATQSPVFAAMFKHSLKESQESKVVIVDFDKDILIVLLEYIYAHKFNEKQTNMDQLFIASNKYQLNHLKMMCEDELCQRLTVDNALDYLTLAKCHNGIYLKKGILNFIMNNEKNIIEKDSFKSLIKKNCDLSHDIIKRLAE